MILQVPIIRRGHGELPLEAVVEDPLLWDTESPRWDRSGTGNRGDSAHGIDISN